MFSIRRILPSIATAVVGIATTTVAVGAAPATAATFHTTFTLGGLGGSPISGFVVDTHESGVPNFENETWQIRGATPGETYFPVITLGGCAADGSDALPVAVLGWPTTANTAGNASTTLKVTRAALDYYLGMVGLSAGSLPPEVPARLLLVPAGLVTAPGSFQSTEAMVSAAVATTDCQLVSTS